MFVCALNYRVRVCGFNENILPHLVLLMLPTAGVSLPLITVQLLLLRLFAGVAPGTISTPTITYKIDKPSLILSVDT